jgi:hypothetical protein
MQDRTQPSMGRLMGIITLYALLGTPLVAFLWETLNRLMAGWFDPIRVALSIPALVMLYFLLRHIGRVTQRIST